MKASISIETLGAVIIFLMVLGVLTGVISGDVTGEAPSLVISGECESEKDCLGNNKCISINGKEYECGCLIDDHCFVGEKCVNNKCK